MKTRMISEMIKTLSGNNLSYYLAAVKTQHKTAGEQNVLLLSPQYSAEILNISPRNRSWVKTHYNISV